MKELELKYPLWFVFGSAAIYLSISIIGFYVLYLILFTSKVDLKGAGVFLDYFIKLFALIPIPAVAGIFGFLEVLKILFFRYKFDSSGFKITGVNNSKPINYSDIRSFKFRSISISHIKPNHSTLNYPEFTLNDGVELREVNSKTTLKQNLLGEQTKEVYSNFYKEWILEIKLKKNIKRSFFSYLFNMIMFPYDYKKIQLLITNDLREKELLEEFLKLKVKS